MDRIKNKVCLVTGGANGIGESIVRSFHKEGARVAFCDTDKDNGEKLSRELTGTLFFQTDISDEEALLQTMQNIYNEYGDIDILINNAGISKFSPLTETGIDEFDNIIRINLRPAFITSREMAIRRNTEEGKKKYGRIINMSSTRYLQSEPGTEGYSASKGGITSITHALAISLSEYNITVNCISPGWIDTGHYGELSAEDHRQHPSGRVGVPEDIARVCLFLAMPENDFINGQNIVVDGGMTKKMIYI